MTMILLYQTEQEAIDALASLEETAKLLWAAAGYTIEGHSVIGKDRNGNDVPHARTTTWDILKTHPEGGYYFTSPRERYEEYFNQLVSGNYQEIDYTLSILLEE